MGAGLDLTGGGVRAPAVSSGWVDPILEEFLAHAAGAEVIGYDLETLGDGVTPGSQLNPARAVIEGFALATPDWAGFVRTVDRHAHALTCVRGVAVPGQRVMAAGRVAELLAPVFASGALVVGHHLEFDFGVSRQLPAWDYPERFADTMVAAWALDEEGVHRPNLKLKPNVERDLGVKMSRYEDTKGLPFDGQTTLDRYAGDDARYTLRWWTEVLEPALRREGLLPGYFNVLMPAVVVRTELRRNGIAVDLDALDAIEEEFRAWEEREEATFQAMVGHRLDLNSPQVLSRYLYGTLGLRAPKGVGVGKAGYLPTDRKTLERIPDKHPAVESLLGVRTARKWRTTYLDGLRRLASQSDDGRAHVEYHQRPVTGRFACEILHQMPSKGAPTGELDAKGKPIRGRSLRSALVAPPGKVLVRADWSQLQLRIFAHYSQDPGMLETYRTASCDCATKASLGTCRHVDIHQRTAEDCGCTRQQAKAINFGLIFGMLPKTLALHLKVSADEAQSYFEKYHAAYPGVHDFHARVRRTLYAEWRVVTLAGRVRHLYERHHVKKLGYGESRMLDMVVNAIVQGTEFDIAARSAFNFWRGARVKALADPAWREVLLVLQLHDELLSEAPPALSGEVAALLKYCMEHSWTLDVPLVAEPTVGRTWHEVK